MSAQGQVHSEQSAATAPMRSASAPPKLYRLGVRDFWNFFRRQNASFILVCAYLFFEYVRPQTIYEFMAGWPLASVSILLCVGACALEGFRRRRLTLADPLL